MNDIDTEIHHITKSGGNVFLDLGFDADEAERLLAESETQIDEAKSVAPIDDAI